MFEIRYFSDITYFKKLLLVINRINDYKLWLVRTIERNNSYTSTDASPSILLGHISGVVRALHLWKNQGQWITFPFEVWLPSFTWFNWNSSFILFLKIWTFSDSYFLVGVSAYRLSVKTRDISWCDRKWNWRWQNYSFTLITADIFSSLFLCGSAVCHPLI